MSIDATSPNQMPLTEPELLEPFVGRFAQEVAQQENALNQPRSPELEAALMRVRQTWGERNQKVLFVGAGVLAGVILYRIFFSR